MDNLFKLPKMIIGDLKPDATIYLQLDPEEAFKRKKENLQKKQY